MPAQFPLHDGPTSPAGLIGPDSSSGASAWATAAASAPARTATARTATARTDSVPGDRSWTPASAGRASVTQPQYAPANAIPLPFRSPTVKNPSILSRDLDNAQNGALHKFDNRGENNSGERSIGNGTGTASPPDLHATAVAAGSVGDDDPPHVAGMGRDTDAVSPEAAADCGRDGDSSAPRRSAPEAVAPPLRSPRAVAVPRVMCPYCLGSHRHPHGFGPCRHCDDGSVPWEPAR